MSFDSLPPATAELIDRYAAGLKAFAVFAQQVGAEHASLDQVVDDPRIEDAEWRLALLGAELDAVMRAELGVDAPVSRAYEAEDDEDDAEEVDDEDEDARELTLRFVLPGHEGDDLLTLLSWLDDEGEKLAASMTTQGYEVREWETTLDAPDLE